MFTTEFETTTFSQTIKNSCLKVSGTSFGWGGEWTGDKISLRGPGKGSK